MTMPLVAMEEVLFLQSVFAATLRFNITHRLL
ncbi:hypothetical protein SM11_chr1493 [Sinorhizobium meliloti SM11]|uniref:Uncharacterized protein n=1 Tax=Sinorhizobium meliloti (strain SM11) TaxID=707241 RepID=F7X6S7_SINMM|nr:hypothetical protein SM11_chr1493 [Sinorhizobium meliloti SM11]